MEFAEVASMSMELLAAPYLSEKFGGFYTEQEAARDRVEHLERIILFWPYMAVVDAFQQWAHTIPTAPIRRRAMRSGLELQRRFMPGVDWSGLEAEMMTGWHRKQHIHRSAVLLRGIWPGAVGRGASLAQCAERSGRVAGELSPGAGAGRHASRCRNSMQTAGAKFAFDAGTLREAVELIESVIDQWKLELTG